MAEPQGALRLAALLLVLGPALVFTVAAEQQPYVCPAAACKRPSCVCASTEAPLQPASSVPQFVVLTNDDAATVITAPAVLALTEQFANRNGCKMPCTWFVSIEYTQPEYIQQLYMKGHEIATHTVHHAGLPNITEIVGARTWLNETAHVPLNKIRGFRGPFLLHNEEQRAVLHAAGFQYDSSITSTWGRSSFSPDGGHNVWPFTTDYGVPLNCETGTGPCSVGESHPGLWEFPVWNIQNDDGQVVASMDPAPTDGQPNITELYIRELERCLAGNRAPLGVYLHAARLIGSQQVADEYAAFFRYALARPDVWLVTISEVLRWMASPVPASQYSMACPTPTDMTFPGGRFCLPPAGGCIQGAWSAVDCACRCINQLSALPGFCPNIENGACTVVKQCNLTAGVFYCQGQQAASPAVTSSPAPAASAAASTSPAAVPASSSSGTVGSPAVQDSSLQTGATASPATSVPVATVQPLGGVKFGFVVHGDMNGVIEKLEAVCTVVAALAGEAPSTCTIASVVETAAATNAGGARHLASTGYLHIVVAIRPAAHTEAQVSSVLAAAQQDGRLAPVLHAIGIQLAGTGVDVLKAAPGGKGVVGAAVGGALGGAVVVCLAAGMLLVVRRRKEEAKSNRYAVGLPVSAFIAQEGAMLGSGGGAGKQKASPPAKGLSLTVKTGPSRPGKAPVSAYASTPRSTATPRHAAFRAADESSV